MAAADRWLANLPDVLSAFERDLLGPVSSPEAPGRSLTGWPMIGWGRAGEGLLLVDEFEQDGTLVIQADAPGIDPERDLEVTTSEGMLRIRVHAHADEGAERRNYLRHELAHDEQLLRELALPEGVDSSELRATYHNGVLEIRIPLHARDEAVMKKVPIMRA